MQVVRSLQKNVHSNSLLCSRWLRTLLLKSRGSRLFDLERFTTPHASFQEGNKTSGNRTFSKINKHYNSSRALLCFPPATPTLTPSNCFGAIKTWTKQHLQRDNHRRNKCSRKLSHPPRSRQCSNRVSSVNCRKTITDEATTIEEYHIRSSLPSTWQP